MCDTLICLWHNGDRLWSLHINRERQMQLQSVKKYQMLQTRFLIKAYYFDETHQNCIRFGHKDDMFLLKVLCFVPTCYLSKLDSLLWHKEKIHFNFCKVDKSLIKVSRPRIPPLLPLIFHWFFIFYHKFIVQRYSF